MYTRDEKLAFIRKAFGSCQIASDSANVAVACPKCKTSKKLKLAIRLDDDRVHCWVCGLGGRLITLLVQYRNNFVHEYITKFSIKNVDFKLDVKEKEVILPSEFKLLAASMTSKDITHRRALHYIKSRGLTERDLWYFKFGISNDQQMMNRVIMPSFDVTGNLNFYTGRAFDNSAFRKYMNCDAEKKAIIFNEINIDWSKELTLVEGPFDLTKCDENATCLLGSSLSEDSKLFYQIYNNKTPIILALDADMQEKSWQRIAKMLSNYDISVKILSLGAHKDVGEMSKQQFLDAKASARAWDRTDALLMKIHSVRS